MPMGVNAFLLLAFKISDQFFLGVLQNTKQGEEGMQKQYMFTRFYKLSKCQKLYRQNNYKLKKEVNLRRIREKVVKKASIHLFNPLRDYLTFNVYKFTAEL